jgi:peptidoglycan/LPS O-acetylase OafA/YrhL
MLQLLGIGGLLACVAIILVLPHKEWPRPPKWMRITAVAIALALAVLAVAFFQAAGNGRDSPGGLVVVALAGAAAVLALRLVVWAWIGRVNPRSIWAAMGPDARSRSRGQFP